MTKKKLELTALMPKSSFFVPPTETAEEEPEAEAEYEPLPEDIDFTDDNLDIQDKDIENLIADIMSKEKEELNDEFDNFDTYDNDDNI